MSIATVWTLVHLWCIEITEEVEKNITKKVGKVQKRRIPLCQVYEKYVAFPWFPISVDSHPKMDRKRWKIGQVSRNFPRGPSFPHVSPDPQSFPKSCGKRPPGPTERQDVK